MQLLPSFRSCYFCGTGNRSGLHIRYAFHPATNQVAGSARPGEELCGYPGILHGGIQSALLDDVMFWAVAHRHRTSSATLEMTCRYHAPANLGQPYRLEATAEQTEGRRARASGSLLDGAGVEVATASGQYLLHSVERFHADILPLLDFEGCSAEMVRHFGGPPGTFQREHQGDSR